jgi:hypothetical protein
MFVRFAAFRAIVFSVVLPESASSGMEAATDLIRQHRLSTRSVPGKLNATGHVSIESQTPMNAATRHRNTDGLVIFPGADLKRDLELKRFLRRPISTGVPENSEREFARLPIIRNRYHCTPVEALCDEQEGRLQGAAFGPPWLRRIPDDLGNARTRERNRIY